MGFDEKVVRVRAAGSGLGYCDFGSSIRKLAVRIAECGFRIAEFKTKKSTKHSVNNKPLVGASRNRWLRSRRNVITPKFRFLLNEPGAKAISSRLGQDLG